MKFLIGLMYVDECLELMFHVVGMALQDCKSIATDRPENEEDAPVRSPKRQKLI